MSESSESSVSSGVSEASETVEVSVRQLVEFILRSGDIDNRFRSSPADAMLEGGIIHRMIQGGMGSDYSAEVPLEKTVGCDGYSIHISGRADGIINNNGCYIIDEIKSMYTDVSKLEEAVPVHLAQAECYAYMFADSMGLDQIDVRMTYVNIEDHDIRYFNSRYTRREITCWFEDLIEKYRKWADMSVRWRKLRDASIKQLEFPYKYRKGQKELAENVYRTIYHGRQLFLEAPTGVGKTLAVLFPAVKSVAEGIGGTIFYLTAKTVAGTVAQDSYDLMRTKGLRFRTVNIAAREKLCLLDSPECNPEKCPYAKGHFDRINDALFELLSERDSYTRDDCRLFAQEKQVCPFEMALDLSLFSDGVICDYNYVFDPEAYLRRFFADGVKGNYLFLVDEAHNLVDRARDMYSAYLIKEDVLDIKKAVRGKNRKLTGYLTALAKRMSEIESDQEQEARKVQIYDDISGVILAAERATGGFEEMFEDMPAPSDEILDFYFSLRSFVNISERLDSHYRIYSELTSDGLFMLKLFNVDPSVNLSACLKKGRSTIFFSATILPVTYYMDLLSGSRDNYAIYAKSVFDPSHLGIFIGADVSSRYTRRGEDEYERIAERVDSVISAHTGNYLVFFPSYQFMDEVYIRYKTICSGRSECIVQGRSMTEEQKAEFLANFTKITDDIKLEDMIGMDIQTEADRSLAGFCVLGGVFSEGIDLKEESLIGAIIVGTGLPMVCTEREILRAYFDSAGMDGFDYAYRIPGMNKVLQAAGRVIRTENDRGIVALLDERFNSQGYRSMFPDEWNDICVLRGRNAGEQIADFWERI